MFGFKKKEKKGKEKKPTKHQLDLVKQYDEGRILQVDGKKDNKKYFKDLDDKKEVIEEVQEEIEDEIKETNLNDLPEIEPPKIDSEDKSEEDKKDD